MTVVSAEHRRHHPIPSDIDRRPFDVVIIGGGINGCGIARDAAMRGLRVLLVEKRDIASGTTSLSTRLIHGGLRYLEHGEVRLVRESLRERDRLFSIAPHLVRPLRFLIPIYTGQSRGRVTIQVGMTAYDLLSGRGNFRHHMLASPLVLASEPGLNPAGLRAAAMYRDGQVTFPERLALENALSARRHGAVIVTHCAVTGIRNVRGLARIVMHDALDNYSLNVSARVVINASGAWVDDIGDGNHGNRLVGGTKGSHIVVRPFPGAPHSAVYAESPIDGRPVFVIPWNDLYLIGTTDTSFAGSPDCVVVTPSEVEYLLHQANWLFPTAVLTRASVAYAYAGVRPLPYSIGKRAASITRRHSIHDHEAPLDMMMSIVGGKLTTYRKLSEEATDRVFERLRRPDPGCRTASLALPGAIDQPETSQYPMAVNPRVWERLRSIYGHRASDIVSAVTDQELDPSERLRQTLATEVEYAVNQELAETLEDIMLRRTMLGLSGDLGRGTLGCVLEAAANRLGWTQARQDEEHDMYLRHIARFAAGESNIETSA